MRSGFMKERLSHEDLLWPAKRAPCWGDCRSVWGRRTAYVSPACHTSGQVSQALGGRERQRSV